MDAASAGNVKSGSSRRSQRLLLAIVVVAGVAAIAALIVTSRRSNGTTAPALYRGPVAVPLTPAGGWRAGGKGISLGTAASPTGAKVTTFLLGGGRNSYTFATRSFFPSLNWGANQWLFVEWKGAASGVSLQLFVDTDPKGAHSAMFSFVDASAGWTTLSFDLDRPPSVRGKLDLGHVYRVRIATVAKTARGTFAVGRLSLSRS